MCDNTGLIITIVIESLLLAAIVGFYAYRWYKARAPTYDDYQTDLAAQRVLAAEQGAVGPAPPGGYYDTAPRRGYPPRY